MLSDLKYIAGRKYTHGFKITIRTILATHTRSLLYQQAKTSLLIYIPNVAAPTNTTPGGSSIVNLFVTCFSACFVTCFLAGGGETARLQTGTQTSRRVKVRTCSVITIVCFSVSTLGDAIIWPVCTPTKTQLSAWHTSFR
jgi:hypothetical protein